MLGWFTDVTSSANYGALEMQVAMKARSYVFDCKYEKPFETDVHFRVLEAFREHSIAPPAVLHRPLGPGVG